MDPPSIGFIDFAKALGQPLQFGPRHRHDLSRELVWQAYQQLSLENKYEGAALSRANLFQLLKKSVQKTLFCTSVQISSLCLSYFHFLLHDFLTAFYDGHMCIFKMC